MSWSANFPVLTRRCEHTSRRSGRHADALSLPKVGTLRGRLRAMCSSAGKVGRGTLVALVGLTTICSLSLADEQLTFDGRLKSDPVFLGPSGEEVVYVVQDSPARLRLMRLRLADGEAVAMHADQTKAEFEPAVSPDGRFLAYVESRGNLSLALVIEDLEDKKQAEVKPPGGFAGYRSPAFTHDGARVAYSFADDGRQRLYSVTRAAGDTQTLVDSAGINNWPSFSADGRYLAFASTREGNYEIYVAGADGSQPTRLTYEPRQDIRPRISPDGERIAFTSNRGGNYDVYIMRRDGSELRRVTEHPERDDYPVWHPDGRRLLLVAERRGRHDLYLLDLP